MTRFAVGRAAGGSAHADGGGACRSQPAAHSRMDTGRSAGRHKTRHHTVLRQGGIRKLYGITTKAVAPAHGKI